MSGKRMREITLLVAERRGLTPQQVYANTHARPNAYARQEVFYLLWAMTNERGGWRYSIPQIAAHFGLDHTTVLYGVRKHMERAGLEYIGRHDREGHKARLKTIERLKKVEAKERAAARWEALCKARGWPMEAA